VQTLAVAPNAAAEAGARSAGVDRVLVEPFSIAELIEAVRSLRRVTDPAVVDLRTGLPAEEVDTPWWASR
jgi:DNA-binding response OmpR family regulator